MKYVTTRKAPYRRRSVVTRAHKGYRVVGFILLIGLITLALAGCGTRVKNGLRIYDSSNHATIVINERDIDRSSVRAQVSPDASPAVYFQFTKTGAEKFKKLTEMIAQQERQRHRPQYITFDINGQVISEKTIDYRIFKNGLYLTSSTVITIAVKNAVIAKKYASEIKAG